MLRRCLRAGFCFRFRKQWEVISSNHIASLEHFTSQLSQIESQNLQPFQKLILLELIARKKNHLTKFLESSSRGLSLDNTVANWYLFQLGTAHLQQKLNAGQLDLLGMSYQLEQMLPLLEDYLELVKEYVLNKPFVDRIRRRVSILEQALIRDIVGNYQQVRAANPTDSSKTKYREDLQFKLRQLSNNQATVVGRAILILANLGLVSKKLTVIAQLVLKEHHLNMDVVQPMLFGLAHLKAGCKSIQASLVSRLLREPTKQYKYSLFALYYVIVNQLTHYHLISNLVQRANKVEVDIQELNINETKLARYLQQWLSSPHHIYPNLQFSKHAQQTIQSRIRKFHSQPTLDQQSFRKYITKNKFKFTQLEDTFFLKPSYQMSNNLFFFTDYRQLIQHNDQTGLLYLGKDYYKVNNIKIKTIYNGPISRAETRRKVHEYYWSKLKKEDKGQPDQTPLQFEY